MAERKETFRLGTAVKITAILNIATATTASITIDDPSGVEKITAASMTKVADYVYSYTYQSSTTNNDGDYIATISIVSGGYTSVVQDTFTLLGQN